jgi:AraC-like DNA-binding protein
MEAAAVGRSVVAGWSVADELRDLLESKGMLRDQRVRRAVDQLLYAPEVRSVQGWARRAGTNRRTLTRYMDRHGLPAPVRWVQAYRLIRAAALMQRTRCTVARAASALGYPDPFTLSNQMQRVLGVRPTFAREMPDWRMIAELWLEREREAGRLRDPEPRRSEHACPVCRRPFEGAAEA